MMDALAMKIPAAYFQNVEELALKLFSHVYSFVSAALYLGRDGCLLDARLFDSAFGSDALDAPMPPGTARAVLVVNQPEGLRALDEDDMYNLSQLRLSVSLPVEIYRVCESQCEKG